MINKISSFVTAIVFCLIIFGFAVAHFAIPDGEESLSERRQLAKAPKASAESIMDGKFMKELDEYLPDHFPLRDSLRSLKAHFQYGIFAKKENNGYAFADGSILKLDDKLDESQLRAFTDKINSVYGAMFEGMDVYFAISPDKNYVAAADNGYLTLDYEAMEKYLRENLNVDIKYLGAEPFSELTLSDYYITDPHWKQENLQEAVSALTQALGVYSPNIGAYEVKSYLPFYGTYYGQAAVKTGYDTINCLVSDAISSSIVKDLTYPLTGEGFSSEKQVYDESDADNKDMYDLYLSGPTALIEVVNNQGSTGRELIFFRDSFGSSIAPLLLESYDKITLVDLRYIASAFLPSLLKTGENCDILFMYCPQSINSGKLFK